VFEAQDASEADIRADLKLNRPLARLEEAVAALLSRR